MLLRSAHRPVDRPPPFLSLEPVLRCPNRRCGTVPHSVSADTVALRCKRCGAHWWATRLQAGDTRAQILDQFDGDEHGPMMLDIYGVPRVIDRPLYWQVWLTGHEHHHFTKSGVLTDIVARSRTLFRTLSTLHRLAQQQYAPE